MAISSEKPSAVIRISVRRAEAFIRFEIYDNGKGIAEPMLADIRSGKQIGTGNGFGTANIRERLALYFGKGSQFEIQSEVNEWTMVTILIPVCKDRPDIKRGEST